MFKLTNARGETVDLNTNSLRAYTPTGLGLILKNTYSAYQSAFIKTHTQIDDPASNPFQVYIKFGDIESQSYQSFYDFAEFLAYQPYTLEYDTDAGSWYRDCNLQSLSKTELGGSTVGAYDRLNEAFVLEFFNAWYNNKSAVYESYDSDPGLATYGKIYGGAQGAYYYNLYYVYIESNRNSAEKAMLLQNDSQYFGLQDGSLCVITIIGPCANPSWVIMQDGQIVATDAFTLQLAANQKLIVSSYPDNQYARVYNPDGSYSDVSQLQDFTKTNFVQIPKGNSTALFYIDATADVSMTFKEERLLV
ncbi:hypothetical protein ATX81_09295 [Oenococcus oeni]|uniref:phage distal tail protein domain-containing protein n=6 Tax=Oenococcus oeni TaxID=1247 RepID=UPI000277B742|nr:phage distal tail protein domain-containing protein [Oenococcus oeni]EJO02427.1 putative phage protein [Oenococcus oeni AWRIB318]EKP91265.1 putative phage protein [Oenococcus oeni AWRIB202]OIK63815.1 hypothetical protein ATW64_09525 [Oenococcus oeni]OIK72551.1 hypothetical protein ATW71_09585 [Oenococcus oeni]OIK75844.1 hypothetical protein ATW72_09525 [Oenococcus oeni]